MPGLAFLVLLACTIAGRDIRFPTTDLDRASLVPASGLELLPLPKAPGALRARLRTGPHGPDVPSQGRERLPRACARVTA